MFIGQNHDFNGYYVAEMKCSIFYTNVIISRVIIQIRCE